METIMKRLSKIVLVLGLVLFGLSGLAGCSNPSGDEGNKTELHDDKKPEQKDNSGTQQETENGDETEKLPALEVDFSQTNIPASPYTYPEKASKAVENPEPVDNPQYVDSTKELDNTLSAGTPVKSSDKIITVTPRYDGLLIQINYNATDESKLWKHNAITIKNLTDNSQIEVSDLQITETADSLTSEVLYKFTEKNVKYQIWMVHQDKDWNNWGTTEDKAIEVTAIGGYGQLKISADKMTIEKDADNNRIFTFDNFIIKNLLYWKSLILQYVI